MAGTIHYRFTVRGGTAAALAARNEIPLARELVVETDTGKMKLGDGVASFSDLPYVSGEIPIEGVIGFRRSGSWLQYTNDGEITWRNLMPITDIKGDPGDRGLAGPPGPSSSTFPTASFDGGTAEIAVGAFCDLYIPFGFEITRVTLLADAAGTLAVDVRSAGYAFFPPGPPDTICGATPPSLLNGDRSQDDTLLGWATTVAAGSTLRFVVTASSGIRRATLVLEGFRT